jgi:branched-chain amino acid transport system substrate-binding protein
MLQTTTGALAGLSVNVSRLGRAAWADEPPIIIGHQADLTGALASIGYWHTRSARAIIERINKEGGIGGRQISYVVEDSESNPAVGVRKLRKLVQEDKVDFVLGSEHGGLAIASAPVARETKTIYSSASFTDSVTGKAGNRYVMRLTNTTLQGAKAMAGWAVSQLGKSWSIIYADYAFGHANRDSWTAEVGKVGGRVLSNIGIPVGTADPMAYVVNVAPGTDAVYLAVLAPDQPRVLTALKQIGFTGQRLLCTGAIDGFDQLQLPEVTDGNWGSSMMPLELSFRDTPAIRGLRDALKIEPNGLERGTGVRAVIGEVWVSWESVALLKLAIEKSGWKQKKDTGKVIEFLEGAGKIPEGRDFPQGELLFRGEDHQGFMDFYVHHVEGKRVRTTDRIPKERAIYPPEVDYRKEPL